MKNKQIEDIYPLSPMQQGMLFHSLYAPDSGVYIIQVSLSIHGHLNIAAFQQAWQLTIDKHPVLRTAFVWEKIEKPMQVVGRKVRVPMTVIDWRSLELSTQEKQLESLSKIQREKGFYLTKAPLMRLILIQQEPQVYQFIWNYHHLLLDGWSVPWVLQDVLAYYHALNQGESPHINKTRPYRDYIAWLQQKQLSQAEEFWRKNLAGFIAPTPFRVDKKLAQSTKTNSNNQKQEIQISSTITTQLQTFAKNHRLTLNTLIQGAFALILSRYSGENDVIFGVTTSGRPALLSDSESMVGLFINTLPMRITIDAKQLLLPWLQEIQEQQIEIQNYEYSPLFEIQRWSDIPKNLPLFESLIVFENYPVEASLKTVIADLNLQNICTNEQNNYPLGLYVIVDSVITLRILYDGDRFESATINAMLGHLQTLLEAMVNDSQQQLYELPLLKPEEQQQLLIEYNNTSCDYSNLCIHQLFTEQVEKTPDKVAVIFAEQQLTYKQLNQQANQLARYLQSIGVNKETRVGICLERSEKMLVGLLGILKAGGTYIPLDPAFPPERLIFMLENSEVNFLVTESATSPHQFLQAQEPPQPTGSPSPLLNKEKESKTSPPSPSPLLNKEKESKTSPPSPLLNKERGDKAQLYRGEVINIDTDWERIIQQSPENLPPQTTPENLAYIIYTSGSTGKPKGVQISHKALVNCLESMQQKPGITSNDILLSVTTLSFDIAALELYLPLISGACLAVVSRETTIDGTRLAQSLKKNKITIMQATPATWRLLLTAGWEGNKQLKILCGGEALDNSLARELLEYSQEVWNLYGPTEATIWSAVARLYDNLESDSAPIGKPINNTQFYVLDDYLQPVPIGVPGQLYIGGAGLAQGYLNQPDLTAEKFIPNPFDKLKVKSKKLKEGRNLEEEFISSPASPASPALYKTGDLVRYLDDGNLQYLGRIDYQVKLRGFRIELGEIEAVLMQYPQIKQTVVVLNNDQNDQRLIAYIIPSAEISQTELRQFLQDKLPIYMLPSNYIMLEEFPLTPNRKIARQALPNPEGIRPELEVKYILPKTQIEKAVAQIWQQVLQIEKVGIYDNFFDLGGHSLLMVKAHSQIREQFSTDISLVDMFRYPTISSLTSYFNHLDNRSNLPPAKSTRDEEVSAGKKRLKQRLHKRKV